MKATSFLASVALLGAGCLMAGCGGSAATGSGPTSTVSTKGTTADLRGGWLIAGAMPFGALTHNGTGVRKEVGVA